MLVEITNKKKKSKIKSRNQIYFWISLRTFFLFDFKIFVFWRSLYIEVFYFIILFWNLNLIIFDKIFGLDELLLFGKIWGNYFFCGKLGKISCERLYLTQLGSASLRVTQPIYSHDPFQFNPGFTSPSSIQFSFDRCPRIERVLRWTVSTRGLALTWCCSGSVLANGTTWRGWDASAGYNQPVFRLFVRVLGVVLDVVVLCVVCGCR